MIGRFFVKDSCPAVRSAAVLASFAAVVLMGWFQARGAACSRQNPSTWASASGFQGASASAT
jgi:hypothetical protein